MIRALGRLEQALLRAEAAGAAVEEAGASGSSTHESLQQDLAGLKARHERLRASAADTVAQLDAILAAQPAEAQGG